MSDLTVRGIRIENLEKQVVELEALAAQYKWQRDELNRELALDMDDGCGLSMMSMASGSISRELDRRWDEHNG